MKKIFQSIVWTLLVFGLLSPLYGATVEVTTGALNVRSGPSTGYRILGLVYNGQQYVSVTTSNGWHKIWYKGNSAWCSGKYLKGVSGGTEVKINLGALNVRSGPSTGYSIVGVSHSPETYVKISQSGDWTKIWFGGAARWCYTSSGYATQTSMGGSVTPPTPQPQPQPQPNPAGQYVKGVDISHWTGNISDAVAAYWKQNGVKHVIAGTQKEAITRQQLQVAVRNGFTVDAYVFLYFNGNMAAQVKEALRRIQGFPVTRLWLDIEAKTGSYTQSQIKAQIWDAIRACGNQPYGIYTGAWWWKGYIKNTTDFANIPLWYAWYDKNPSLSTWSYQKFGGWQQPWGKQYQGTTNFGGVVVDFNTIKVVPRTR